MQCVTTGKIQQDIQSFKVDGYMIHCRSNKSNMVAARCQRKPDSSHELVAASWIRIEDGHRLGNSNQSADIRTDGTMTLDRCLKSKLATTIDHHVHWI